MAEEGIVDSSIRKLFVELGMTAANLYNYFPNKLELFTQMTLVTSLHGLISECHHRILDTFSFDKDTMVEVLIGQTVELMLPVQ